MRTFNLIILLICTTYSFGQLFVNPRPVKGFQVLSEDVLAFDIINTPRGDNAQETVKVRFLITIRSVEGPVVEMFSGSHVLRPGLNSFLSSNCHIVRKNYLQRSYATFEAKTQSLPIGNYQYCIRLLCDDIPTACGRLSNPESSVEGCNEFTVLPISPLLLSSPEDEEILKETKRPNFQWIPPMPLGSDPAISYEFTLVHLKNEQKGEDAIRRNRPLYQEAGIASITRMYPTTLEDLVEGERYAWQVKAHLGNILAATSEVWEFEVEKKELSEQFVNLNLNIEGVHFCNQSLDIHYSSEVDEDFLNYRVTDQSGNDITPGIDFKVDRGVNKFSISSDDLAIEKYEGHYRLEVIDPKGRQFLLLFKFTE